MIKIKSRNDLQELNMKINDELIFYLTIEYCHLNISKKKIRKNLMTLRLLMVDDLDPCCQ